MKLIKKIPTLTRAKILSVILWLCCFCLAEITITEDDGTPIMRLPGIFSALGKYLTRGKAHDSRRT